MVEGVVEEKGVEVEAEEEIKWAQSMRGDNKKHRENTAHDKKKKSRWTKKNSFQRKEKKSTESDSTEF